jgi:aminoglycoside/choline kinase family phosphotransferase
MIGASLHTMPAISSKPAVDRRFAALAAWAAQALDVSSLELDALHGGASARRYFRVRSAPRPCLAAGFPAGGAELSRYLLIAGQLRALGLNVPEILASDRQQGYLLVSDLGERLYLDELRDETVERLYGDALGALVVLQTGTFTEKPGERFLPDYTEALLQEELGIFREWYLARHLGLTLAADEERVLTDVFEFLVRSALGQPRVWTHRDFHSRNLLVTEDNSPGILDFQDAVRGPVTYDLVSLLRDCYIGWPRERVVDWVKGYHELCIQSGIPVCEDEKLFVRWFDLMGVQRHLKAVGIFARLARRDGRPDYLPGIPRTLGYVSEVGARYPELGPFARLLESWRSRGEGT